MKIKRAILVLALFLVASTAYPYKYILNIERGIGLFGHYNRVDQEFVGTTVIDGTTYLVYNLVCKFPGTVNCKLNAVARTIPGSDPRDVEIDQTIIPAVNVMMDEIDTKFNDGKKNGAQNAKIQVNLADGTTLFIHVKMQWKQDKDDPETYHVDVKMFDTEI